MSPAGPNSARKYDNDDSQPGPTAPKPWTVRLKELDDDDGDDRDMDMDINVDIDKDDRDVARVAAQNFVGDLMSSIPGLISGFKDIDFGFNNKEIDLKLENKKVTTSESAVTVVANTTSPQQPQKTSSPSRTSNNVNNNQDHYNYNLDQDSVPDVTAVTQESQQPANSYNINKPGRQGTLNSTDPSNDGKFLSKKVFGSFGQNSDSDSNKISDKNKSNPWETDARIERYYQNKSGLIVNEQQKSQTSQQDKNEQSLTQRLKNPARHYGSNSGSQNGVASAKSSGIDRIGRQGQQYHGQQLSVTSTRSRSNSRKKVAQSSVPTNVTGSKNNRIKSQTLSSQSNANSYSENYDNLNLNDDHSISVNSFSNSYMSNSYLSGTQTVENKVMSNLNAPTPMTYQFFSNTSLASNSKLIKDLDLNNMSNSNSQQGSVDETNFRKNPNFIPLENSPNHNHLIKSNFKLQEQPQESDQNYDYQNVVQQIDTQSEEPCDVQSFVSPSDLQKAPISKTGASNLPPMSMDDNCTDHNNDYDLQSSPTDTNVEKYIQSETALQPPPQQPQGPQSSSSSIPFMFYSDSNRKSPHFGISTSASPEPWVMKRSVVKSNVIQSSPIVQSESTSQISPTSQLQQQQQANFKESLQDHPVIQKQYSNNNYNSSQAQSQSPLDQCRQDLEEEKNFRQREELLEREQFRLEEERESELRRKRREKEDEFRQRKQQLKERELELRKELEEFRSKCSSSQTPTPREGRSFSENHHDIDEESNSINNDSNSNFSKQNQQILFQDQPVIGSEKLTMGYRESNNDPISSPIEEYDFTSLLTPAQHCQQQPTETVTDPSETKTPNVNVFINLKSQEDSDREGVETQQSLHNFVEIGNGDATGVEFGLEHVSFEVMEEEQEEYDRCNNNGEQGSGVGGGSQKFQDQDKIISNNDNNLSSNFVAGEQKSAHAKQKLQPNNSDQAPIQSDHTNIKSDTITSNRVIGSTETVTQTIDNTGISKNNFDPKIFESGFKSGYHHSNQKNVVAQSILSSPSPQNSPQAYGNNVNNAAPKNQNQSFENIRKMIQSQQQQGQTVQQQTGNTDSLDQQQYQSHYDDLNGSIPDITRGSPRLNNHASRIINSSNTSLPKISSSNLIKPKKIDYSVFNTGPGPHGGSEVSQDDIHSNGVTVTAPNSYNTNTNQPSASSERRFRSTEGYKSASSSQQTTTSAQQTQTSSQTGNSKYTFRSHSSLSNQSSQQQQYQPNLTGFMRENPRIDSNINDTTSTGNMIPQPPRTPPPLGGGVNGGPNSSANRPQSAAANYSLKSKRGLSFTPNSKLNSGNNNNINNLKNQQSVGPGPNSSGKVSFSFAKNINASNLNLNNENQSLNNDNHNTSQVSTNLITNASEVDQVMTSYSRPNSALSRKPRPSSAIGTRKIRMNNNFDTNNFNDNSVQSCSSSSSSSSSSSAISGRQGIPTKRMPHLASSNSAGKGKKSQNSSSKNIQVKKPAIPNFQNVKSRIDTGINNNSNRVIKGNSNPSSNPNPNSFNLNSDNNSVTVTMGLDDNTLNNSSQSVVTTENVTSTQGNNDGVPDFNPYQKNSYTFSQNNMTNTVTQQNQNQNQNLGHINKSKPQENLNPILRQIRSPQSPTDGMELDLKLNLNLNTNNSQFLDQLDNNSSKSSYQPYEKNMKQYHNNNDMSTNISYNLNSSQTVQTQYQQIYNPQLSPKDELHLESRGAKLISGSPKSTVHGGCPDICVDGDVRGSPSGSPLGGSPRSNMNQIQQQQYPNSSKTSSIVKSSQQSKQSQTSDMSTNNLNHNDNDLLYVPPPDRFIINEIQDGFMSTPDDNDMDFQQQQQQLGPSTFLNREMGGQSPRAMNNINNQYVSPHVDNSNKMQVYADFEEDESFGAFDVVDVPDVPDVTVASRIQQQQNLQNINQKNFNQIQSSDVNHNPNINNVIQNPSNSYMDPMMSTQSTVNQNQNQNLNLSRPSSARGSRPKPPQNALAYGDSMATTKPLNSNSNTKGGNFFNLTGVVEENFSNYMNLEQDSVSEQQLSNRLNGNGNDGNQGFQQTIGGGNSYGKTQRSQQNPNHDASVRSLKSHQSQQGYVQEYSVTYTDTSSFDDHFSQDNIEKYLKLNLNLNNMDQDLEPGYINESSEVEGNNGYDYILSPGAPNIVLDGPNSDKRLGPMAMAKIQRKYEINGGIGIGGSVMSSMSNMADMAQEMTIQQQNLSKYKDSNNTNDNLNFGSMLSAARQIVQKEFIAQQQQQNLKQQQNQTQQQNQQQNLIKLQQQTNSNTISSPKPSSPKPTRQHERGHLSNSIIPNHTARTGSGKLVREINKLNNDNNNNVSATGGPGLISSNSYGTSNFKSLSNRVGVAPFSSSGGHGVKSGIMNTNTNRSVWTAC